MLELVEGVPLDEVEDSRNGVLGEGFITVRSVEKSDEDRRITHDEDRNTPYLMRASILGVFVADRCQRST